MDGLPAEVLFMLRGAGEKRSNTISNLDMINSLGCEKKVYSRRKTLSNLVNLSVQSQLTVGLHHHLLY